jgi:hypothetical protein
VLDGGFGLWLGDNIAILYMVKRAHPLYSNTAKGQTCLLQRQDGLGEEHLPR